MAPTTGPSPGGKRRKRNVSPGRTSVSPERPDDGAVALLRGSRDRALELLDQAARFNLENTKSPHTRRAYAGQWHSFELWCQEMGLPEMPARAADIVRYLNHLELQGKEHGQHPPRTKFPRARLQAARDWGSREPWPGRGSSLRP